MKPMLHSSCPQCGELHTVTNKLLATNLYKGEPFIEAFQVNDPEKFEASPYTRDDYFVDALWSRGLLGIHFPLWSARVDAASRTSRRNYRSRGADVLPALRHWPLPSRIRPQPSSISLTRWLDC